MLDGKPALQKNNKYVPTQNKKYSHTQTSNGGFIMTVNSEAC